MWCWRKHRWGLTESLETMKTFKDLESLLIFLKKIYDKPVYKLYDDGTDERIRAKNLHLISVNGCGDSWFWESKELKTKNEIIRFWRNQC